MKDFSVVMDFIDLVKNPDKYQDHLKEIATQKAAYQEMVEKVAKASQIEALYDEAKKAVASAKEKQELAERQVSTMLDAARQEVAAMKEKAERAKSAANASADKAAQAEAEAVAKLASVVEKEKEAEKALANAADFEAKAALALEEVQAKLEKLRSVMT